MEIISFITFVILSIIIAIDLAITIITYETLKKQNIYHGIKISKTVFILIKLIMFTLAIIGLCLICFNLEHLKPINKKLIKTSIKYKNKDLYLIE